MRTIVDLPDQDVLNLDRLSRSLKASRTELVRRAVSEYLKKIFSADKQDAFGIWKKKRTDGVSYQRKLRDEWDR